MKIAYVMGRGHNGSTVTNLILGNHPDILATGEMNSGLGGSKTKCSCGKLVRECEFWGTVIKKFEEKRPDLGFDGYVRQLRYIDRFWRIPQLITGIGLPSWARTSYVDAERDLFEILSNERAAKVVFDSSKAFGRATFFLTQLPEESVVIYLVRDARGIIWSHLRRHETHGAFVFLRKLYRPKSPWPVIIASAFAILGGELFASALKLFYRNQIMTVRYEDLCTNPRETLRKIGDRLGIDTSALAEKLETNAPLNIDHVIGGNPMRMHGTFIFKSDFKWKEKLPKRVAFVTNLITFPYQKLHGYR